MKLRIVEKTDTILFPGALLRASDGLPKGVEQVVVLYLDKKSNKYHHIGTVAQTVRLTSKIGTSEKSTVLLQGDYRVRVINVASRGRWNEAEVEPVMLEEDQEPGLDERVEQLKTSVKELLEVGGQGGSAVLQKFLTATSSATLQNPGKVVDILASILPFTIDEKLQLLDTIGIGDRVDLAVKLIEKHTSEMKAMVPAKKDSKYRELLLKRQLKVIQGELRRMGASEEGSDGADGEAEDEDGTGELKKRLERLPLDKEGRKIVTRELNRLKRMHPTQAEYQVCRTYLETIAELPWGVAENSDLSLETLREARKVLDEDHYGLEKVKKRLIEYLTVLYLKQQQQLQQHREQQEKEGHEVKLVPKADRPPILLLVGPPGVGKTSLAKSVARALNRQLHRISLGGVRDEAEIRGHRRTYVGAMPGLLVQALRKVAVMNPVIVLDEIDKINTVQSLHGDPSAAMLEVLDPEQNSSFTDHYINFPVDLSQVLFIATANSTESIPAPLLDRMEMIHIDGYTYQEKLHIAQRYLVPKQVRASGLESVDIGDEVLQTVATKYTREAGVRNFERQIGSLCRGKAVDLLNKVAVDHSVSQSDVRKYLGIELYQDDVINDEVDEYEVNGVTLRRHVPGVVNGLAYMGSGTGGILCFEATSMANGSGKLNLTGKLGDVISESAQIAMSWVRSNCAQLGIKQDLTKIDIHLHAPAGAIPKDGPSAGVAMTLALVSLLLDREVPQDIAMTGEMTLRGKVLPVGGIREKLLGAHLAGVHRVILPYHCRKVVHEECKDIKVDVSYVKYMWDLLNLVWPDMGVSPVAQVQPRL
ncbi:hypothetical protein TRVA0_010S00430 [Trichomonascus vanleenenianus]|uniref:uncharacterized protein n=1 Tax=Trichomonascus vanleenenianus TaxID=2268995 RepID=UPI003ECB5574